MGKDTAMATLPYQPQLSRWALVALVGAATAFALVSTVQAAAYLNYSGEPIPWFGLLKARLVNWYLYAAFVPLLWRMALRWPVDRSSWKRRVPLHAAAGLACAAVKEVLFVLVGEMFRPGVFRLPEILAGDYFDEVLVFWAATAIIDIHLGWARARNRPRKAERPLDRFVVSGAGGYRLVPVEAVEWIGAQGNYAQLNTSAGRHLVRETMASLERKLGEGFVRVHRGAIVSRAHIRRIEPRTHGAYAIVLDSGAEVLTGRSYNSRLRALIG